MGMYYKKTRDMAAGAVGTTLGVEVEGKVEGVLLVQVWLGLGWFGGSDGRVCGFYLG